MYCVLKQFIQQLLSGPNTPRLALGRKGKSGQTRPPRSRSLQRLQETESKQANKETTKVTRENHIRRLKEGSAVK